MYLEDGVNVAIAGATGAVGEALLEILQERNFPVKELFLLLASCFYAALFPHTLIHNLCI